MVNIPNNAMAIGDMEKNILLRSVPKDQELSKRLCSIIRESDGRFVKRLLRCFMTVLEIVLKYISGFTR